MNKLISIALIWKVALLRLFLYCLMTVGVGYLGAMGNTHWSELDGDSRFKLVVGLGTTLLGIVLAFLDKTAANLAQGELLPPDIGDAVVVKKNQSTVTAITPAVAATSTTPAVPELTTAVTTSTVVTKSSETKT